MRSIAVAAICAAFLSGCHFLAAAPVVDAATGLGIASGIVSVAKDVLELDVTAKQLFAPPQHVE